MHTLFIFKAGTITTSETERERDLELVKFTIKCPTSIDAIKCTFNLMNYTQSTQHSHKSIWSYTLSYSNDDVDG